MDAIYTVEFEEFPLGSYAGLTTPYFIMKLTGGDMSIVRSPDDWYPYFMGRCVQFPRPDKHLSVDLLIDMHPGEIKFVLNDVNGGIVDGVAFFDLDNQLIKLVEVTAGEPCVVALKHPPGISRVHFLTNDVVYFDNYEAILGPASATARTVEDFAAVPATPAEGDMALEYFEKLTNEDYTPELKTPLLMIQNKKRLNVISDTNDAFPHMMGKQILLGGDDFYPEDVTISFEVTSRVRFTMRRVSLSAIRGHIEFYADDGTHLGTVLAGPDIVSVVAYENAKGIRKVRFKVADNVVVDNFEFRRS